jgi:hypothetical protein
MTGRYKWDHTMEEKKKKDIATFLATPKKALKHKMIGVALSSHPLDLGNTFLSNSVFNCHRPFLILRLSRIILDRMTTGITKESLLFE